MLGNDQLKNCERRLSLSSEFSDQRSVAAEGVRKLFNELQTCEHILTPLIGIWMEVWKT